MTNSRNESRPVVSARTTAGTVARRIRRGRHRFYRGTDFDGSRSAVEKALGRLVNKGELVRVRNGLYWRGAITPFGMSPPNPREVVAAYADGLPIGPAGLSAANYLGLTTQVPRIPEYAAPSVVPDIDRIRIHRRMGRRAEGRKSARLGEPEVAFLEVLDAWDRVVELPPEQAIDQLLHVLDGGLIDIGKIVRASSREPARSRVRLQMLLEQSGKREEARKIRSASTRSIHASALEPLATALR